MDRFFYMGNTRRIANGKTGAQLVRNKAVIWGIGVVIIAFTLVQLTHFWQRDEPQTILENPIDNSTKVTSQQENHKRGSSSWKVMNPGAVHLQGYASKPSAKNGEPVSFYVHSEKPFRMEIYRMGYYQGLGGRLMYTKKGLKKYRQKISMNPEGCDWKPNFQFRIPANWPSGYYVNKLIDESGRASYIPFVVTERKPKADFIVLIATNSYHAYNNWGGKSLYAYNSTSGVQSKIVSYHRPYKEGHGAGSFFQYEYNLIRWLEREGYNLTYVTDMDVHEGVLERSTAKAFLIAGHAEYWSMEMRKSIEKVTASRMNLANFSANVGYWQVRLQKDLRQDQPSQIVAYKQFAANQDPYRFINPELLTTRFRDKPVSKPENLVLGTLYMGIPAITMPLVVTNPTHWIYQGTELKKGDQIPGVIGGEVDGFRPLAGGEVIARSPVVLYGQKQDATVVWYTKPTGKKAFSVGTFYWNWFLDPINHESQAKEDKRIQQMTRNALRELSK